MNETLPKETLSFLQDLAANNDRDWFAKHKPAFIEIQTEVKQFYAQLFEKMKKHDNVDAFKLYRIYRDVRFSKNKQPYKTHFGGSYSRKKPELRGGYYVHIQPNNESFIATGFWEPNAKDLLRIRKEIEQDACELREAINEKQLKATWGTLQGDELKTAPRGFKKDDPNIDLLRKKQYLFIKKYTDKEVLNSAFIDEVNQAFKEIRPFFDCMSTILTTDLNGVSII